MAVPTLLPLLLACPTLAASSAAFQGYRLNDPLARAPQGQVDSFVLSPSGAHAVFLGDLEQENSVQLHVAPVDGSAPARKLTDFPSNTVPSAPQVTADGTRVAFLRSLSVARRMYVVPIDGSTAPGQLNGAMVTGGSVLDFLPAPVGNRIVFRAAKDVLGMVELYSVPADFSAPPVKLNGPMQAAGDVEEYRFSPDGQWVVYRADQDADQVFDLYSARTDGSAGAQRLNVTRPNGDVQGDFAMAFDSLGVVYRADQTTDEVVELFAVRVDGSAAPMQRNGALVTGGDVEQFTLSAVDDRLVYRADQATNDVFEIYSVRAIPGGTPLKLNGTLVSGGDVVDFRLAPDAQTVVYRADQVANGVEELFGVPANASAPAVQLSQPLAGKTIADFQIPGVAGRLVYVKVAGFGTGAQLFSVPLDGSLPPVELGPAGARSASEPLVFPEGTVLMRSESNAGVFELHAAPIDGSAPARRRSGRMVSEGQILTARATSDGARAVFLALLDHADAAELYSIAPASGPVRRLSPPLPLGAQVGEVFDFALSADATRAVYSARQDSSAFDLYGVATDGTTHSVRLNEPHGPQVGIGEFALSPDGSRVVYEVIRDNSFTVELHSAPSDGVGPGARLDVDGPFVGNGFFQAVSGFAFSPDSSQVVFVADQETDDAFELFRVPSDASGPPVRLHPAYSQGDYDERFAFSASGAWLVYTGVTAAGAEVYSVPLDGHQPATRLNAPFITGGNVGGDQQSVSAYTWTITPDESRVVYLADQDTNDVSELYVVPIDGSAAPLKLNATLVAGGDVAVDEDLFFDNAPYLVSPDSTRLVYRADQDVDGELELYVVPLAGGPAQQLNGTLVTGGDVGHFEITPDATRVVYVADEEVDGRPELWSVPLDASAPRVKLSGTAVGGVRTFNGFPRPFRISSTGRVVFQADLVLLGQVELWSAPLDGSAPPQRLNALLPLDGAVNDEFQLTPDGTSVVYFADQLVNEVHELFHVPLDASAPPRRISGPFVTDGDVAFELGAYRLVADLVLYRADQDTDGVFELYATRLDWSRAPRRSNPPTDFVMR